MKKAGLLISVLLLLFTGCHTTSDSYQVLEDMQENLDFGNVSTVIQIADSLKNVKNEDKVILHVSDSLRQIAERINLDFSVDEFKLNSQLDKLIGHVSANDKSEWDKNGWLEWKMIDGTKKYFNRAASNLILIKNFNEQKKADQKKAESDPEMLFRLKHTEQVLKSSGNNSDPVVPVKMKITYTITVHPDVVPEGEKIRCWLPFPKTGFARQQEIELLSTSNPEYVISPDSSIHSTVYMENTSKQGVPAIFQISYIYISHAQHFNLPGIKILPYNKDSYNFQKFTEEQLPHICFTDNVKKLADSITAGADDPASIVNKIYFWFKENITWTGALEYSIIPNIPEYVIKNKRGDCGMQTFLFISMLRYKGIPSRWQSGWMMPPENENLHDWSEVWYEGTGWVPADVSYDLQKSENKELKNFYFSGIDSYRLIVNDGVGGPLHPEKQYLRSEPSDFQRGEVEWKGGNLYFDKWDYNMKIEYIK